MACVLGSEGSPISIIPRKDDYGRQYQNLVTWDKHSIMVCGERLFIFSGEFHPFRLPVPGLWLDVFQKIKAMGFNGMSFYTDYDVGDVSLVYCTADIFTWAVSARGQRLLIVYGGAGETHEFAVAADLERSHTTEGASVKSEKVGSTWERVLAVRFAGAAFEVQVLWRNDAYNRWALELEAPAPVGSYSSPSKSHVIVKGGYLLRTAKQGELKLMGDTELPLHTFYTSRRVTSAVCRSMANP
ncbi:hypothetical protein LTR08_002373 [Meristemomyces frigidus]|nr:hypothetical protein LTR08_002373 [Meristemomyces frigidus]